jgi:Ca2+-binding EF-hand superfamily protein
MQAIYSMHGKKNEAAQKVKEILGTYDRDGSGTLSKEEFFKVAKAGELHPK